jgi:probable HAF family extracellular repeat protein
MRKAILLLMAATSLMVGLESAKARSKYLVTDLGANSSADGINGRGDVVGTRELPGSAAQVFIYKNGRIQNLTTPPAYSGSVATGINNSDEVIGTSVVVQDPQKAPTYSIFLYEANRTRVTIQQSQGPVFPEANAINNSGAVVGSFDAGVTGPLQHAFIYRNGQTQDIGALLGAGFNDARSINNAGQVVGTFDFEKRAFLYSNGRVLSLGNFVPDSINDQGWMTGEVLNQNAGTYTAILYAGGQLRKLGTLPGFTNSRGVAINNGGEIVGLCSNATGDQFGVFLYTDGQMRDLNKLVTRGWVLTDVSGINDLSQIAATGSRPGSTVPHALLLDPRQFSDGLP